MDFHRDLALNLILVKLELETKILLPVQVLLLRVLLGHLGHLLVIHLKRLILEGLQAKVHRAIHLVVKQIRCSLKKRLIK
ncbi:hypothetical protein Bhyg_08661 [Pseudolycoriella hygida]|uniref:Uncharacterized protein n=1 Tax=Pseudolycoriella hygida TaxID=35572 RepID=A0A9Q0N551_9DIPT|nr:hypothetical protein Bhyg_08661 [Pseudolycoriella hygida]